MAYSPTWFKRFVENQLRRFWIQQYLVASWEMKCRNGTLWTLVVSVVFPCGHQNLQVDIFALQNWFTKQRILIQDWSTKFSLRGYFGEFAMDVYLKSLTFKAVKVNWTMSLSEGRPVIVGKVFCYQPLMPARLLCGVPFQNWRLVSFVLYLYNWDQANKVSFIRWQDVCLFQGWWIAYLLVLSLR